MCRQPRIIIKGAGEMASGVACALHRADFKRILMLELPAPFAVRRRVAFSEAVHDGVATVEGITAVRVSSPEEVARIWNEGRVALRVDPEGRSIKLFMPDVLIDATLAKRNTGVAAGDAPVVIALGPGFRAGTDCHLVVETNRGENMGRLIRQGFADQDTGIPAPVNGYAAERVLRSPGDGIFAAIRQIGDRVRTGDTVGKVGDRPVAAAIDGVLRGLIRQGTAVTTGLKIGDIDPRGESPACDRISDKAQVIGRAVVQAVTERIAG